jgi:hypothetical protein
MNAQLDRAIRKMETTSPRGIGSEEGSAGEELKNFHSSSWVASDGTFPTHITHGDRSGGGFGCHSLRATGLLPEEEGLLVGLGPELASALGDTADDDGPAW